ncbi:MAG: hypothetical protein ACR2HA_00990 [Nocardioides sp.]
MTTTPNEPVGDGDIETVPGQTPVPAPDGDADDTDGDSTDTTDGDSTDGTDADGTDA